MKIKALGPGCMHCKTLEKRTIAVLQELGIDAVVEKVEEYASIASYGILQTPGLVIDEKIVHSGSVPTLEKLKELLNSIQRT